MSPQLSPNSPVVVAGPVLPPPGREPVSIILQREAGGYSGSIGIVNIDLAVDNVRLANLNANFTEVLEDARKLTARLGITLSGADHQRLANLLADEGWLAFQELFPPGTPARDTIDGILGWDVPLNISIYSDSFPFFWEMLYSRQRNGDADLNTFWGYRHVIARRVTGASSVLGRGAVYPVISRPAGMLMVVNRKLRQAVDAELPDLEAQAVGRSMRFRPLDQALPRPAGNRVATAQEVVEFLSQTTFDDDIVHFACHFSADAHDPDRSRLELTLDGQEIPVRLRDLESYNLRLSSNPLVFLNACSTDARTLLESRNFVEVLMRKGARGVIATECTMPDAFAAAFAGEFYRRFFSGMAIGEALWETSTYFLTQHQNLLGLAYALYADSRTRIEWPG